MAWATSGLERVRRREERELRCEREVSSWMKTGIRREGRRVVSFRMDDR